LQLKGKIVAPSMSKWVGDSFSWIQILYVNGLTIDGDGGSIDGHGSTWWEKCRKCRRPKVCKVFTWVLMNKVIVCLVNLNALLVKILM